MEITLWYMEVTVLCPIVTLLYMKVTMQSLEVIELNIKGSAK